MIDLCWPILFVCWGSFLNVLGTRLITGESLLTRSHCQTCNATIAWYDLIPVISWCLLRGRCRSCKASISWLYPSIEIVTAVALTMLLASVPGAFFFPYFIFFSALIVTIRSDSETMLISQYATLFLIPIAFVCACAGYLPISLVESIIGALFGYIILYVPAKLFAMLTKKEGIGVGDIELLAFIGSFLGSMGVWLTLLIGSITGSLIGLTYLFICHASRSTKIPFGPFLAFSAMIVTLYLDTIIDYLLTL